MCFHPLVTGFTTNCSRRKYMALHFKQLEISQRNFVKGKKRQVGEPVLALGRPASLNFIVKS